MADSKVFLNLFLNRLKRWGFLVLLVGAAWGTTGYFYAKLLPTTYASYALLFPVNPPQGGGGGALESIFGGGGNTGNGFSNTEGVNIIDLARSKTTGQAVALTQLPEFGNKTIGELLIEDANKAMKPWQEKYSKPTTENDIRITGGDLARGTFSPNLTKTGSLELRFTHTNPALLSSISYIYIEKISQYFITLKVSKANSDYEFMVKKLDSINIAIHSLDSRIVELNRRMLFVPKERMEFTIPMARLETDKMRLMTMRTMAYNNIEEALWRKQKATPIMKILDPPDPPYFTNIPGKKIFILLGFIAGIILGLLFLSIDLIYKLVIDSINKEKEAEAELANTTIAVGDSKVNYDIVSSTSEVK